MFLAAVVAVPVAAGALTQVPDWISRRRAATGAPGGRELAPDGDSGEAVQAAVDEVHRTGGGVVRLRATTYTTDAPVLVRSGVLLSGVGPASVIKAGPRFLDTPGPLGGHPLITTNGASDVTIADLTADQSGDVLDGNVPGRLLEYLVDGRSSTNLVIEGVQTRNPFTYSIAVVASSRFRVSRCRTSVTSTGRYDQLDGIHVLGSTDGDVVDNDVDQGGRGADGDDGLVAHTIDERCHSVVYRGNRVRGGRHGAGMQLAVGSAPLEDIVIRNNVFYGSPRGLHARSYDGGGGVLRRVTVGGSASAGNFFHENGASAVDLTSVPVEDTVVSHNTSVSSGGFTVAAGWGNRAGDNEVGDGS